jgi:BolA family transcriptional regulator, general stress-responsive regulator
MVIREAIQHKLTVAFEPQSLEVTDESDRHAGHAGAVRQDRSKGETHFQVRIVSASFEGLSRLERQRRIHAALTEELNGGVHALSLSALTPSEAARS